MRTVVLGIGALLSFCAHAGPSLVFSETDLPVLRQRCETGPTRAIWSKILANAETLCTPGDAGYADPASVSTGGEHRPDKLQGNVYGGRLRHWMETLGFAYWITGEERFADHARKLLVATAKAFPPDQPPMRDAYMDGWGNMMRGLAFGIDFFGDSLDAQQRKLVQDYAAAYLDAYCSKLGEPTIWWRPYHNYSGISGGGAGLLAIAMERWGGDASARWREPIRNSVEQWLTLGFDVQGAYCEGTSYAEYGLGNTVAFMHALRRRGYADLFTHPRIKMIPQFFAMSMVPGEVAFDPRNDSHGKPLSDPFMLSIANATGDRLALWFDRACSAEPSSWLSIVWAMDGVPRSASDAGLPNAIFYPGRGLLVCRTGWTQSDWMFAIEAGPFYRKTHNQADKGHFTLYGRGVKWAIDSGYGNTQEPDGAAQTLAHNCILIDGQGQALSGAGLGTYGRVLSCDISKNPATILLDCTDAYRRNSDGLKHLDLKHAHREATFHWPVGDAPGRVTISDDIVVDEREHTFTWLLQTDANNTVHFDESSSTIILNSPQGEPLTIALRASSSIRFSVEPYRDHQRIRAETTAVNPAFVATIVLAP